MIDFKTFSERENELIDSWNDLGRITQSIGNMSIWHYSRFEYIIDQLVNSSINLGQYCKMIDKNEGQYPENMTTKEFWKGYERQEIHHEILKTNENINNMYMKCWTYREKEFEGFWNSFSDLKSGIAIKTTVSRLYKGLHESEEINKNDIEIYPVKYLDLSAISKMKSYKELNFFDKHNDKREENINKKNQIPIGDIFSMAQIKSDNFFHEREVRISYMNRTSDCSERLTKKLNWKNIVDEVYCSPKMPDIIYNIVIKELNGYQVKKSNIYNKI